MDRTEKIYGHVFHTRILIVDDVDRDYLDWFSDPVIAKYITNKPKSIKDLRNYVALKLSDDNCLFFGIFVGERHVGNIKYDPIDRDLGIATMGIMIGDSFFRGKHLANLAIKSTIPALKKIGINKIVLGVDLGNIPAIKAYLRAGFKEREHVFMEKDI